jgi:hypothetical protein
MAEASSTILFTFGGLATVREQLIYQRCAALYILSGSTLRTLDAALLGSDAQFVVFDPQDDFIPNLDAQRLSKRRWDHDTAVLIHSRPGFFWHWHTPDGMTLLYHYVMTLNILS